MALLVGAGLLALIALILTLSLSSNASPASANPATGFVSVSAGGGFTCGLTKGGGVKCWGANSYGQLGDGTTTVRLTPVDVLGLTSGASAIGAAEGEYACAVTGGDVRCWGSMPVGAAGLTDTTAVSTGLNHVCALTMAGAVYCWGDNQFGELGDGTTTDRSSPVAVSGLSSGVVAVAAGEQHTCALTEGGAVKCWGRNDQGQLGSTSTQMCGAFSPQLPCSKTPQNVSGLSSGGAEVSVGGKDSCALTAGGGVKCWGRNDRGQLGNGTTTNSTTPVAVSGLTSGVSAIAVGGFHACAVMATGSLKCWGYDARGQLGNGTAPQTGGCLCFSAPVDVIGLSSGVARIAVGSATSDGQTQSCAVMSDGGMKCWGFAGFGAVGDGTTGDPSCGYCRVSPVDVVFVLKPTPTPCPTDLCTPTPTFTATASPTPTATPTPCPTPGCGLDFSIGTDLAGGAGGTCDSSGTPTAKCSVPLDGKFKVSFYLNSLPTPLGGQGPAGYDAQIQYAGVTSSGLSQSVNQSFWPSCALSSSSFDSQQVHLACGSDTGGSTVAYTGRMATIEFTCSASGVVTLRHGYGLTDLVDGNSNVYSEAEGSTESININCVPPQTYPGDTDGDGCPDAREQGTNQMLGGRRNFLNPWDYFNPTHDGQNRVDDILAVVQHYGRNQGDAGYSTDYDRTYLGPNPWNLGPPNGQIRVDDILAIIKQFDQDCS